MAIPNYAFFDLETRKISTDFPDGWGADVGLPDGSKTQRNILRMQFGVGCIFDNQGIRFYDDPMDCLAALLDDSVDAIIGYNTERFDLPVLLGSVDDQFTSGKVQLTEGFKAAYGLLKAKSIDLLRIVEAVLGHRVKLDQITQVMFDHKKEQDGATWWPDYNSTDLQIRTRAVNYLLGDVMQLYKIYGVAHELGQLAYKDQMGQTRKFSIKVPTVASLRGEPF